MNIKRIGAVNWDAALPKTTYFGGYMLQALSTDAHKARLPYFTKKTDDGYDFSEMTQADYDSELTYAKNGGIDFFMYCWYPENDGEEKSVGEELYPFLTAHLPELNKKRKLYFSSTLSDKPNACAIVLDVHAYSEKDIDLLIESFASEHYEKIGSRPLVFVFLGGNIQKYNGALVKRIKQKAKSAGWDPYFALMAGYADGYDPKKCEDIDAITTYAVCRDAKNSMELAEKVLRHNETLLNFNIPVIPVISAGWNPTPRIDNPEPWVKYDRKDYAPPAGYESFSYAFSLTDKWISENKNAANTEYAVVFAWNEFEEGGYLCPTLADDGSADTSACDAFLKARSEYAAK